MALVCKSYIYLPGGVPMSLKERKIKVLAILSENLKNPGPQLVPSATIAGHMNMSLPELQQLLKSMEGVGLLKTNVDLRYNLITREGLLWFNEQ